MRQLICLVFISLFLMSAKNPPSEGIEFFQGSFTSAKIKAAEEGKLFFLDFTASWCTPCKWMEETTFTDPTLAAYVKENYVALQVDIDDFDGYALKQQYKINILPSLLIFNSKGEVLAQYEESMSPSNMIAILKKYDAPENRIASRPMTASFMGTARPNLKNNSNNHTANTTESFVEFEQPQVAAPALEAMELPATFIVQNEDAAETAATPTVDYTSNRPQAVGTISRTRLVKKDKKLVSFQENNVKENPSTTNYEHANMNNYAAHTESVKPTLHHMPATVMTTNNESVNHYSAATTETNEKPLSNLSDLNPYTDSGEGLYRFEVRRQHSTGFSLQVGAYAEYGNVLQQSSLLQQQFDAPIIVHISKNRNRTLYKLMLGEFDTRTAAINFMRTVQDSGLECMVKDLSNQ